MAKDLGEVTESKTVARAEVEFYGEKIILPEGMKIPSAITVLTEREKYMQQTMAIHETFNVFPWDGAWGLLQVLKARFGWAAITGHPSFWGPRPPQYIQVEVGPGQVESVPWGVFTIPNAEGAKVSTGADMKDGRISFKITAELKRTDEPYIRQILSQLRDYLSKNSIYRGKAVKLRLYDDNGQKLEMPEPKFIDTSKIDRTQLILSRDVEDAIATNLFTPIERVTELSANGLQAKRGVLLGGKYGTGKTLAAYVAAKLCVQHGVSFIYVSRASELAEAIAFAEQYQSPAAWVFCEDIDREMKGTERTAEMDSVLNIVDGIDTKNSRVSVVLTTNHMEELNQAMLRPGRLDAVIEVTEPNAEAMERLLRWYGGAFIDPEANLSEVGQELAGQIPAVVAEVVKRAKLTELKLTPVGQQIGHISQVALLEAAKTMRKQLELLQPRATNVPDSMGQAFSKLIDERVAANALDVADVARRTAEAVLAKLR